MYINEVHRLVIEMSKLLLDSQPLVIIPELAAKIGLNGAIVVQQIHYWVEINRKADKNHFDGHYWTYNTFEGWAEQFPFWSIKTIKRTMADLENSGLVATGNFNKLKMDHTKWYRLRYDMIDLSSEKDLCEKARNGALGQNDPIDRDTNKTRYDASGHYGLSDGDKMTRSIRSICPNGEGHIDPMERDSLTPAIPETNSEITPETKTDISTFTHAQEKSPNIPDEPSFLQVITLEPEKQSTALGQAASGSNALALVPQAQAEAAVTADSPQPERTPEEKAFSEITTLYIDNKFTPSASFFVQDGLAQLVKEYGDTWVMGALQVALKYNSRSLGYVETVLDNWAEKGMAPWKKPRLAREAHRGGSPRQMSETASGGTAHVQSGKYDEINERIARLRQGE